MPPTVLLCTFSPCNLTFLSDRQFIHFQIVGSSYISLVNNIASLKENQYNFCEIIAQSHFENALGIEEVF